MSLYVTDYDTIRVESPTDHLAHVVLDPPDDLDTVSDGMLEDLDDLIDDLEVADAEEARAVYFTGAGEKVFSAGTDLGGGFELSVCADLRMASESAGFGLPERDRETREPGDEPPVSR